MSDFENDLECLTIHLGSRLTDSSDSGENDELDEEYQMLRPSPIPAEVIRQNSIYRPPSPNNEAPKINLLPVSSGSRNVPKVKISIKKLQAVVRRKENNIRFTEEDRIVRVHVKIAKDLIKVQHEMFSYNDKLSIAYLDALEKFRINLDSFGNMLKNLISKKAEAVRSISPPQVIMNLENNIDNFRTLLSNLYAFTISEYLSILIASTRFNISNITSIIIKTLDLIENIGKKKDIQKKIQFRTFKTLDDLNFGPLVAVKLSNDEIMNELKMLFPDSDESKKTRNKRIRKKIKNITKSISREQKVCIDEKSSKNDVGSNSQEIFGHGMFEKFENTNGITFEKSQIVVGKLNAMDKEENFKYLTTCKFDQNDLSTQENASTKSKSRSKKKKNDENLQQMETTCDKKSHVNIVNSHPFSVCNNEVTRTENKDEFNSRKNEEISENRNRISDAHEVVTRVENSDENKFKKLKANYEKKDMEINEVNTNLINMFGRTSISNENFSGENVGREVIKKEALNEMNKNNDFVGIVENFLYKVDGEEKTSFSTSSNTKPLGIETNSSNKETKFYEANCTSSKDKKKNVKIIKEITQSDTKSNNRAEENCDVIGAEYQVESELIDLSKYHPNSSIGSKIFSELYSNKEAFDDVKNTSDDQKLKYNFGEIPCEFMTESILRLTEFSNIRVISLLNILQYSVANFEVKYSIAAFETMKDCFKILHSILRFNDLLLTMSSAEKLVEIAKCYLPTSKVCQANLYAYIVSRSTEFIRSLKSRLGENEAKVLYSELLELTDAFGTTENINQKLKDRNDNFFIELAQQVCSIIPASCISASNEGIVENIESIRKARKKFIIKPTEVLIYHLKLPTATHTLKFNEFNVLHFDMKSTEILVKLQNLIYNSGQNLSEFHLKFENINKFCATLKTLEEYKKKKFEFGTFVHAFLHNIDSILSRHILRILLSEFYTFIFDMLLIYFSNLPKVASKKNAKSFRNNLLNLMSFVCPIEKIPEKLRFRNDDFFVKYTNALFSMKGIVVRKSSKELCKEISDILKTNKSLLEKVTEGYISYPTDFKTQISKLEGKSFVSDELFDICIQENGSERLINFKVLTADIMQVKKNGTNKPGKNQKIELNGTSTSIEQLDISGLKNKKTKAPNQKVEVQLLNKENYISKLNKNSLVENVKDQNLEPVAEFLDPALTEKMREINNRGTQTLSVAIEYNMKAVSVLNVLQYTMETFEIKYSGTSVKVLKDCINILKGILDYNNSLLNESSVESVKGIEECYLPITELCQAHFFAYLLYFSCLFAKTLKNRLIHEESEKLYFMLLQTIESFGTNENIYNKLKCRNDRLFMELAQKVCSIIPVICAPSSNSEIMQGLSYIRNSSESRTHPFHFMTEDVMQMRNGDLQIAVCKISPQNCFEVESLQHDLKEIELLSILQHNIQSDKQSSELDSVLENMKNFVVILKKFESKEEREPSIDNLAINLKTVSNHYVSRIFVSQFYSFILFVFSEFFHNSPSSLTEEIMNSFHLKIFELLVSICPLQKLPLKLQFRNDVVYSTFVKALLNIEGFVVYKSSEKILQGILDIVKTHKIEKANSGILPECLSIQIAEFERNIFWTKYLINMPSDEGECFGDFENVSNKELNISATEKIETLKIERNLNNKKVESSVISTTSKIEDKHSAMILYLQTFVKSDIRDIIIQIMNNREGEDISLNSIMRRIEYSSIKMITTLNFLQYSFDTYDKKYSIASFQSVLDCLRLIHLLGKFTELLSVSSSTKLQELETSYVPILEICQTYFYAYILSTCCEFIKELKTYTNQKEFEILYSKVLEMVNAFGTLEEIYEKLKYRNDNRYIELVKQLCSVIPSTLILPSNDYLLQNISFVKDSQEGNKIPFELIISENPRIMNDELKNKRFGNENFEFECPQLDLNKIKVLTELQYDIHFHDRFPTKFCLVFENLIHFFVTLKSFEQDEIELSGFGNFVDIFSENLDITCSLHISRILIAQFYSFIFTSCLNFLKKLPELVSKEKVTFFRLKLINLLNSNCPIDEVFEKIQFRNYAVYSKFVGDFLKMNVVEVAKSFEEIISEVFDLFKTNEIYINGNSISSVWLSTRLNTRNLQTEGYELSELNNYFKVVVNHNISQLTSERDTFKITSKNQYRKSSQNIYLSFQGQNDCKYIVLNFVDEIFADNGMRDDIFISIFLPISSESECKYINVNNEKIIFEQYAKHFFMKLECFVTEEMQNIFWMKLLRFAQKQKCNDTLNEASSETKNSILMCLNNFQRYISIEGNSEERQTILHIVSTELNDKERCIIQFHSLSALILNVISREMDQLITTQKIADISEMTLSFKVIFLCILKRLNELSKIYCRFVNLIRDCRRRSIVHGISLIQSYNKFFKDKMKSDDFNFILHREQQYFSLHKLLEFLITDETIESNIMNSNSEQRKSYFSRFFSWFDIVIFESCVPFKFIDIIQQHLIKEQKPTKKINKIELYLQKQYYKNNYSTEYSETQDYRNSFLSSTHLIGEQEFDISVHQQVHQISSDFPRENSRQIENDSQCTSSNEIDENQILQIAFEWSVIFLIYNIIIKSYFFYITIMWIVMFHLHSYL